MKRANLIQKNKLVIKEIYCFDIIGFFIIKESYT